MPTPDKPTPPSLNLDKLEREGAQADPFVFILGGKRITMIDASDIEWQTLLDATSQPRKLLRLILRDEDQETFFAANVPSWKLNALMGAYFEHFGVDPEALAASRR